jgi:hypothetical protein
MARDKIRTDIGDLVSKEVSNNVLAVLMVVAVVVVISGTFFSFYGVQKIYTPVTGMNTQSGNISIEVLQDITIYLMNTQVNFGSGYINDSNANSAIIDTEGTVVNGSWSSYSGAPFVLRNDGNIDVNVSVVAGANATDWLGTGAKANYKITNNESSSCTDLTCSTSYCGNLTTFEERICGYFHPGNANDQINLHIQLTIPNNISGNFTTNLTFTSYAAA